ncbi:MAG TPA: glycosyltransferase, partial [Blastocatellia bacterium]|nr:glycosyltransferase [Blastocatellia bacterium]
MRHLIICREYPPAPSGGIGTYAFHLSHLLAEAGETVHVIGQMWGRAPVNAEELCQGRLIIHRVPFEDWTSLLPRQPHPRLGETEKSLFRSDFAPQAFSWQASLLAEQLIEQEAVDIIEAQDYEAPLYYFQLRRAIGKGPKRQPPCLIHLHSPTEFIALHNEWDLALPGLLTARRLEDYSIAAADALLCPSNYLARQTTSHYRFAEDAIKIIPYPIGDTRILERDASTWESGPISYVGRLEKRKGVIEWVEAAVAMARQYRDARFEFVGGDTLDARGASLRESLEGMIPGDLKPVFCFRGEQNRSSLSQFLARARAVVVPSRWENFPNTCIEAMGSGLPVIASREGGMTEMIEDGRTGWLAGGPGSEGLREALSRALETPAAKVAEMGREAASRIRQICDNQRIVEEHIELRRRVVHQGATRSLLLPANLPWARSPLSGETPRRAPKSRGSKGLAVVITCSDSGAAIDGCLQRLTEQTREPASVVIVDNGSSQDRTLKVLGRVRREGWQVIRTEDEGSASARNAGIGAVLGSGSSPLGFVFLDAEDRLKSNFID